MNLPRFSGNKSQITETPYNIKVAYLWVRKKGIIEMIDYAGKEALAWLWVNPNFNEVEGHINSRCYVFPRYLIEDNKSCIS